MASSTFVCFTLLALLATSAIPQAPAHWPHSPAPAPTPKAPATPPTPSPKAAPPTLTPSPWSPPPMAPTHCRHAPVARPPSYSGGAPDESPAPAPSTAALNRVAVAGYLGGVTAMVALFI
ncbi:extensin-like [Mangifera indica]|uniref:extensin-like n=1 Tax=Mangifera indica TaxID=29780 RepID=UPI001CFA3E67|nr:extensin-like [Mangifera indica]